MRGSVFSNKYEIENQVSDVFGALISKNDIPELKLIVFFYKERGKFLRGVRVCKHV